MHEQAVREQKDFISLINKIKSTSQQKGGSGSSLIEELMRECNQTIAGREEGKQSYHPVFVELGRFSNNDNKIKEQLQPWSDENREHLSVLHL